MLFARGLSTSLISLCLLFLSGCTAINSGVGGYLGLDTDLKLTFEVDADSNPDERKKPSPVFVRLYELKSTKMFNKSDFIDIYERDQEALGADLIAVQKLRRLTPGEQRIDSFVLDPATRYVALYAEFLRYKDSTYRVVIPVVPNNVVSTTATVRISGNTIKIVDGSGFENPEEQDDRSGVNFDKTKKTVKKTGDVIDKGSEAADKAGELF